MGNACSCPRNKSDNPTWDRMSGRPDRHNPSGKGPDGKVFMDEDSKYNKNPEAAQMQSEEYHKPDAQGDDGNFNPGYYKIVPKMQVQQRTDPQNPDQVTAEVTTKMVYDPKNEIGKIPAESQQEKKARLQKEREKQQAELEKIQKRTQGDFDDVLNVSNDASQKKQSLVPVKASGDQQPAQMAKPTAPGAVANKMEVGEAKFGEPPRKIEGLATKIVPIFDGATLEGESKYAYKDIVHENSKWREIHKAIKTPHVDRGFPATLESLKGSGFFKDEKGKNRLKEFETYKFQRLSEVVPDIEVIVQGISPNDIFQGQLGNCYFLSSLAAVAENPQRIARNILQKTRSSVGAYCICLCITGCWIPVVVDDMFPVKPDGLLAFTHTKHKEMWAMLFEKAYAKAYGAYSHIGSGGTPSDALKDLTGCPTSRIDLKQANDEATALQRVVEADKKNFIMTASSKGQGEKANSWGIVSGHAYSLIGVKTLSNGVQLLKIRNPWGRGEWTGDWGDKSPLWTSDFKKQAEWVDADDGVFYMTYADFKKNFEAITIGYYHDDYYYSFLKSTNPDEALDLNQFVVDQTGEYYLGVSQPSSYLFAHDKTYKYGYISTVILRKLDDGSFKFIDGFSGNKREEWCKLKLEKGNYLALIYTNWDSANTTYTFWTYGVKNTVIRKIKDHTSRSQAEEILAKALMKKGLSEPQNWVAKFNEPSPNCMRTKLEFGSYGYACQWLDNQSAKIKCVEIAVNAVSTNYECIYPPKSGNTVNVQLGQKESKMVLFRSIGLPNQLQVGLSMTTKSK